MKICKYCESINICWDCGSCQDCQRKDIEIDELKKYIELIPVVDKNNLPLREETAVILTQFKRIINKKIKKLKSRLQIPTEKTI